jgi:hypothetical protein
MHAHWPHAQARLDRRQMLVGTAGVVAGGALAASNAQLAFADDDHGSHAVVPPPKPIPGGLQIPGGPFIHVFLPGPTSVTLPFSGLQLMGLNVEPSTITDFSGSAAVAMLVGSATGSDGKHYNLETDLRFYEGTYVAENGARHEGTFGFI